MENIMKFLDELLHNVDDTPTVKEGVDYTDIDIAAEKLMRLAVKAAISELTEEHGENYQDYLSSPNAVADEAMKIIRYHVNFADLIELTDS
jgi:hypothetical protein